METVLPLPFLVSVAVPPGLAKLDGLTREEVSILRCPFIEAQPQILDKLSRFFQRHNYEFQAHLDVTGLTSVDEVATLLDGGARKAFVAADQLSQYSQFGGRVIPTVTSLDLSKASEFGLLIKDFDIKAANLDQFVQDEDQHVIPEAC